MDLEAFNLDGLQNLHISYQRVLSNHIKQLEELPDDNLKELMTTVLKQKIASFEAQIVLIENKIEEINAKKLRFSYEFMVWNYGLRKSSVQVHFLTTSDAYKVYGPYVTGQVLFDEAGIPELLERIKNNENNDGVIKFEEIVSQNMPDEIKEKLKNDGFNASEISLIY
jgi:hypothetical protein